MAFDERPKTDEKLEKLRSDLLRELTELNDKLSEQIRQARDWKLALRNGVLIGFGTTIGAAILGGILLAALRPFEEIEALKPALERIARQADRR